MTLTLSERERLAYMAGDYPLAELLGRLEEAEEISDALQEDWDQARCNAYDDGYEDGYQACEEERE